MNQSYVYSFRTAAILCSNIHLDSLSFFVSSRQVWLLVYLVDRTIDVLLKTIKELPFTNSIPLLFFHEQIWSDLLLNIFVPLDVLISNGQGKMHYFFSYFVPFIFAKMGKMKKNWPPPLFFWIAPTLSYK